MRVLNLSFAALVLVMCLCSASAQADLITIKISGQVKYVDDQYGKLQNQIYVGQPINGTYTFDSAASGPPYDYYATPCGISLYAGGFNFATNQNNVHLHISVGNNDSLGEDYYSMISYNNSPLSNGALIDTIILSLQDPTGTALSSDALPLTAPDLTKWPNKGIAIDSETYSNGFFISAQIISAEVVPEPATVFLLGLGAMLTRKRLSN